MIEKGIDVKVFVDKNKWEINKINSFNPKYEEYKDVFK